MTIYSCRCGRWTYTADAGILRIVRCPYWRWWSFWKHRTTEVRMSLVKEG